MELRPRPPGREYRGYTRVAVRRWIKDPAERVVVPEHIANLSSSGYAKAFLESERHRAAVKKAPKIPAPLDSGFYEPEILTVRRSNNKRRYLQRHPDMKEPTSSQNGSSSKSSNNEKSSKSSKSSKSFKVEPVPPVKPISAVYGIAKIQEPFYKNCLVKYSGEVRFDLFGHITLAILFM